MNVNGRACLPQFLRLGVDPGLSPSSPSNLLFRCFASGNFSAARLFGSNPRRSPSVAINAACCLAILIHALSTPAPRLLLSIQTRCRSLITSVAFLWIAQAVPKASENETVERGIDARRHVLLDDLDAAAGIVGQMLRDKRRAEGLDARFLDQPAAWVAVQAVFLERRSARICRRTLHRTAQPPESRPTKTETHCHLYHSVRIEPRLREKSPENGNIREFGRRLSAISL